MEIIQGLGMLATLAWLLWARRDLSEGIKDLSSSRRTAKLNTDTTVLRRQPFSNSENGRFHYPNTSA